MSKTVSIFLHHRDDGPARLISIFEEHGFIQTELCSRKQSLAGFDALAPDLLVVMGGPMGVYETDEHPYLKDEIRVLKERIAADRPTLGICLGAQLIAAALGARNYKGEKGFEIGWKKINVTPAGKNSPARHLDASQTCVFQWHQDTFDLPVGVNTTLLATSPMYQNQIFSYGKNIMAIQSHPEVIESQLDVNDPEIKPRLGLVEDLKANTKRHMPVMDRQFRAFMAEWMKQTGLIA